jgi:hypothetical protein
LIRYRALKSVSSKPALRELGVDGSAAPLEKVIGRTNATDNGVFLDGLTPIL